MKNNWPTKKLGEVADIVIGQSPPSSSYNERGEGLPFFQGKAEFREIYPTPVKYCSSPSRIAEKDDILISVRAPVGNINIAREKSCVGRGLGALRAKKNILNQMFLFYFMKKNENNWSRLSTGSTFSAIKGSSLKNFEIPLPPLATQKQIVERLDKIAEAQKLNDDLVQKSDELFQSLLHRELKSEKNWKAQKLENLLELCDAGVWGKATKGGGMMVLRSTNFKNGGVLDFSNVPELKINEKKRAKVKLMDGDILLEKSGGGPDQPVGRVAYFIAPDQRVYTFANFIQRLRSNSDVVNGNFLFYHLLRLHNVGYTKKLQSQTTGIRNLKSSLYLKTEIPLPPLETQKQIVAKLSAVQEYKKQVLKQKTKLKELFDSVLHKSMAARV